MSTLTHVKFALRDDIGLTNGLGAMTAEDVKFSFERIVSEEIGSTNRPDMGPLSHVEVAGEREGTIFMNEPFTPLFSIALPYIVGNFISKKATEAAGGIGTDPVAESGPYLRDSWSAKSKSVLKRNPDLKGEAAAWDTIEIYSIDDENTAKIAFEAGELDFTRVSLGAVERYRSDVPNGGSLIEYPSLFYVWLGMNLDHPKLQNIKLRQAIQHAIDVPSILQAAYFNAADASTGILAPGLPGNRENSLIPPEANFEKAAQLLTESGETNVTLTLDILNKTTNSVMAQVIQATLAQIGITVEINNLESGAFWASGDNENLQLILNRYSMTPDPYYATSWFVSDQIGIWNWNWERFSNEEFDKIHIAASQETDFDKRATMYRRAQDLMEESGAYRFITHEANPVVHSAGVIPALPDGASTLISYGILNLKQRNGREVLAEVIPGESMDVTVRLNDTGWSMKPGHRLRLALSTQLWPMAWPVAERAVLDVELAVRDSNAGGEIEGPFGPAVSADPPAHENIKPSTGSRHISQDVETGQIVVDVQFAGDEI